MNKKIIITVVVLVMLVVGGIFIWQFNGEIMQGFIRRRPPVTSISPDRLSVIPYLTVTLSPTSPSGSRTVMPTDDVMIFDICTNNAKVSIKKFEASFHGEEGGLNPTTNIWMKNNLNERISRGALVTSIEGDEVDDRINYTITIGGEKIAKQSCKSFSLETSTRDLINERSGTDVPLNISLTAIYDANDELNPIRSNLPLNGNTLNY